MHQTDDSQNSSGPAAGVGGDFLACWRQLSNKGFFFGLVTVWLLFFNFLGSGTIGYTDTTSLFLWMYDAYRSPLGTGEDGHGLFIPFVVLALFWRKRRELSALPQRTWWPGLLLLAGALAVHVLGYMVQQPRISIVALFAGIYALMGLAWGPAWLRASFFPFFLFIFCIPIDSIAEPITIPLRHLVAKSVATVCNNILGMNVIREGSLLFNAQRTYRYEVAAACSGLRSFIAIFALSTIYGFVTFEKSWKRILIMASAFPLSVVGNIMRMMGIIIVAEVSGQSGGDYVHESFVFSLMPYIPAIIGLVVLGYCLRERPREPVPQLKPHPA